MKTARSFGLFFGLYLFCLPNFGYAKTLADGGFKKTYASVHYTVTDGLPENLCWSLFQDSKGYVWAGTNDGFARCDGKRFTAYWDKQEVNVLTITENASGEICALTHRNICVPDAETDTLRVSVYNESWRLMTCAAKMLPPGYAFYESTETAEKALFAVTDTAPVKVWTHPYLARLDNYRKPYWDMEGRQFFVPLPDGVYVIGEDGAIRDSVAGGTIHCMFPYRNGIRAAGSDGIYEYTKGNMRRIFQKEFVCDPTGVNALVDPENRLLIQDVQNIYRYDGSTLETVFTATMIFDMLLDREKNLWAATYNGVYNCFRLQFGNYRPADENEPVRSVLADKQNRVWAATLEGHLYRIAGDESAKQPTPRVAGISFFQGMPAMRGDTLLFPGCYRHDDVYMFFRGKGRWMDLSSVTCHFIVPLPDGKLLLGGYAGITICDADGKIIRRFDRNRLQQTPSCAMIDNRGRILIGGSYGIMVLTDSDVNLLPSPEGFGACRNLKTDRYEKVFASSGTGLYTVEDTVIRLEYTFNDIIRSVFFTRDNILIVGTLKGIYIKRPTDRDFFYYDHNNGFTGKKIQWGNMTEDNDGNVWLIAEKDLIRFRPEELLRNRPIPILQPVSVRSSPDNIDWMPGKDDRPTFDHKHRNVRFNYIGLCYSATDNIRYRYRLIGFQDEWSQPVSETEVTFNNLPPGHYEFQLKADTGSIGSETAVVTRIFTIRPAFWQTWWFAVAAVLLLMLLSTGAALFFQQRKNRRLTERLETEKQLNELRIKSIRLRSIPHFNANVLAAIEYYIMNLSKEDANRLLNIYSEFTGRTLREVDKASRSLHDELDYVLLYLQLEKLRFMEKFDYEVNIDPDVDQNVQLPNMILHTYCENAVKHGFAGRASGCRLKISARRNRDGVEVCVEDNGVGRVAAEQNKNIRSTKQGLDILSRQIEIYNRFNEKKIERHVIDLYNGGVPVGTCFTIEVPYGFVYR